MRKLYGDQRKSGNEWRVEGATAGAGSKGAAELGVRWQRHRVEC